MEIGDDAEAVTAISRKEKRKLLKKEKRQQRRREIAVREKEEEEARLSNAEEQSKLRQLEEQELDKMEMDRMEFEERERMFLQALELNRRREQQEYGQDELLDRHKRGVEHRGNQSEEENAEEVDNESDWEYVEEGPAEIIWKGNEIIVKKRRVKVPKKNFEDQNKNEDLVRPISNPLAPQSEDLEDCKSVQQILDTVAQEDPYFGTEQDKANCPFHLKTGACRFGTRCSRVHFYPDKSCTLLMKNMYGGLGLMWEEDDGLEVCRNGSSHLRGNVYVHYKSVETAVLAYKSTNGRYFAGKQVLCEFVNLTRWKVAICGEYMRSGLVTCSRGSTCNFIHCFRNPGGDYEWADWDRKPPAYWINKMNALFGNYDGYDEQLDEASPDTARGADRHYSTSRSRELNRRHSARYDDNNYWNSRGGQWRSMGEGKANSSDRERHEGKMGGIDNCYIRGESSNLNYEGKHAHKKCGRSRWLLVERNSESSCDGDISVEDRFRQDYKSLRSKPDSNGKSSESDSGSQRSGKDGSEGYLEDRIISRQKTRDSCRSDYERDSREEIHIGNPEGYHICKNHRHRSKTDLQEDRRRSSRLSDLSEQTHASSRDKHRKRERSRPKSESRRSSKSRKDRAGSNVALSDKDAWDQRNVKDYVLELENEQACRFLALEKLRLHQLQKLPISVNSRHNVMMATSTENADNSDIEAEPRNRPRI